MKKLLKSLGVLLVVLLVVDIYTTIALLKSKTNVTGLQKIEGAMPQLVVEREYQQYVTTLLQKIARLEQELSDLKLQINNSENMTVSSRDRRFDNLQELHDIDNDRLMSIQELRGKQIQLGKEYQQKKKTVRCLEQVRDVVENYIKDDKTLEHRIEDILGHEDYLNYYYEFNQNAALVDIIINSLMNEFGTDIYTQEEWSGLRKDLIIDQREYYKLQMFEDFRSNYDKSAWEKQSLIYKKIIEQNLLTARRFLSTQQFEYIEKVLNREYDILVKVNEVNAMNAEMVFDEYDKRYETGECIR